MRTSALHGVHVISICEGFVSRTAVNLAVSGIRPRVNPTCRGKEEGLGGGETEREREECGGSDKARTPVRNQQREQERGKGGATMEARHSNKASTPLTAHVQAKTSTEFRVSGFRCRFCGC